MKSRTICTIAAFAMLPSFALAEGKANHDWAEEAARKYEEKAAFMDKKGNAQAAEVLRRMAQIKRDAGAAAKAGKKFDWSEYHQLNEKLQNARADKHAQWKKGHQAKDKAEGKREWAEKKHANKDAGAGFWNAAEEYDRMGKKAMESGDADKARTYFQLGAIKRQAAVAAKQGKGFDWTEYHKLKKSLHGGECEKHEKHEKAEAHQQDHSKKFNLE